MKRHILIAITIILLSINQAFASKLLYKCNDDYGRTYSVSYLGQDNYEILFIDNIIKIKILVNGTATGFDEHNNYYEFAGNNDGLLVRTAPGGGMGPATVGLLKPNTMLYMLFMKAKKYYLKDKNNLKHYLKYNK